MNLGVPGLDDDEPECMVGAPEVDPERFAESLAKRRVAGLEPGLEVDHLLVAGEQAREQRRADTGLCEHHRRAVDVDVSALVDDLLPSGRDIEPDQRHVLAATAGKRPHRIVLLHATEDRQPGVVGRIAKDRTPAPVHRSGLELDLAGGRHHGPRGGLPVGGDRPVPHTAGVGVVDLAACGDLRPVRCRVQGAAIQPPAVPG